MTDIVASKIYRCDWGGEQSIILPDLHCNDFDMLCNDRLNKQFVFRDTLLTNLLGI